MYPAVCRQERALLWESPVAPFAWLPCPIRLLQDSRPVQGPTLLLQSHEAGESLSQAGSHCVDSGSCQGRCPRLVTCLVPTQLAWPLGQAQWACTGPYIQCTGILVSEFSPTLEPKPLHLFEFWCAAFQIWTELDNECVIDQLILKCCCDNV